MVSVTRQLTESHYDFAAKTCERCRCCIQYNININSTVSLDYNIDSFHTFLLQNRSPVCVSSEMQNYNNCQVIT